MTDQDVSKLQFVGNIFKDAATGRYLQPERNRNGVRIEETVTNGVEGPPQGSSKYTSEYLQKSGMVGIYKKPGDESFSMTSNFNPYVR